MIHRSTSWSVLIYGTFVAVLGLSGYYFGGSQMSLYTGGGSGALLMISALAMFAQRRYGGYGALLVTTLLTAFFAYRYAVVKGAFPAVMAVFSGAMLLFLLTQITKWRD